MTEADGSGEGDSPAVEKFAPRGVGAGRNWRGTIFTMAGVTAAAAVCAPAFVFAVVFVPARTFVPVCVVPVELPLKPLSPAAGPPTIPPV